MFENLEYALPLFISWLALVVVYCACFALGLAIRSRLALEPDSPNEKAFNIAQGGVSVLAALILGFSFSFASTRFETRRMLVVEEANAIGTTYLRAAYLPRASAVRFRSMLRDYTQTRLDGYADLPNLVGSEAVERKSVAMQGALWRIAVTAARDDPRNVQLGLLTQTLNDTMDIAARQSAALRSHVPVAMLRLELVVSFVLAMFWGTLFSPTRRVQIFLAIVLAVLFATVITTVIDLDLPQSGLVRINLTPLQMQLQSMR